MDPIRTLVHTYADAVCHRDADQWASTWTEDAVWDLGRMQMSGRDTMKETWAKIMQGYPAVIHVVLNGSATLDEGTGTGTGRWYTNEYLRMPDGETRTMWGYYDDTYRLVDGQWLFATRKLTSMYNGPTDMSAEFVVPGAD